MESFEIGASNSITSNLAPISNPRGLQEVDTEETFGLEIEDNKKKIESMKLGINQDIWKLKCELMKKNC